MSTLLLALALFSGATLPLSAAEPSTETTQNQKLAHPVTHGKFGPFQNVELKLFNSGGNLSGGKISAKEGGKVKEFAFEIDWSEISTSLAFVSETRVLATAFLPVNKQNLIFILVENSGSGPADDNGERDRLDEFHTLVFAWSGSEVKYDSTLSEKLVGLQNVAAVRKKLQQIKVK